MKKQSYNFLETVDQAITDMNNTHILQFDTSNMDVKLDEATGRLSIRIPAADFDGPVLALSAVTALHNLGLSQRDIEDATEDMLQGLALKVLLATLKRNQV